MKIFLNMKISKKLIVGFLVVAIMTAAVGTIGIIMLQQTNTSYAELYQDYGAAQGTLGRVGMNFNQIRSTIRDILLTEDAGKKTSYLGSIKQAETEITNLLNNLNSGGIMNTSEEQSNFDQLNASLKDYFTETETIANLSIQGKNTQAQTELYSNAVPIANKANQMMNETFDNRTKTGLSNETQMYSQSNLVIWILAAVVGAAVVIAVFLGLSISKSITKPLNKMVDAANKLAAGDANIKLDIDSKNELGVLSRALQGVVASINNLISDANMLVEAAREGRLSTRADVSLHEGDYGKIVEGVNNTLDYTLQPLSAAAAQLAKMANGDETEAMDVDIYNGDFRIIMTNLNMVRDSLNLLLEDSLMLVDAALDGRLSTRADENRHKGGYRQIVEGVNKTLDAVIEPVNEVASVLYEMTKGNLDVNVKGDYKGDLATFKDAMNETVNILKGYIDEISAVLAEMAKGNMAQGIESDYRGSFNNLKASINSIIDSLNQMLLEIKNAADQVASGTSQVSSGSQTLAQGAAEQASSIEELTASILQVSTQTQQNAANATSANELALVAKDSASKGNGQMKEMLKSMDEIDESSNNISKIIKVIDDIAFQTNILALNAAVEAARAGIHGKGFAVVAEEVRNLAAKSADAAKETTVMIEGSIKKVEQGTKLANETAFALNEIVQNVDKASLLVGEIAGASNAQASAIAQINTGLEQVSTVVQSNSATAQESAATSEELSGQADLLKNLAGQFRLREANYQKTEVNLNILHTSIAGVKDGSTEKY